MSNDKNMTAPKLTEAQRRALQFVAGVGTLTPRKHVHALDAGIYGENMIAELRLLGLVKGLPGRITDAGRAALRGEK